MNLLRCCQESVNGKNTLMDREVVENLSSRQKVAWWIKEAIEHLSRRNLETSMDQDCDKICQDKKKEGLNRRESIEKLSSLKKMSFSRRKNTKRWMQQASYSNIDPINILSSQNISQHICKAFMIQKTHTHNKFNQFYISKTSYHSLISIY